MKKAILTLFLLLSLQSCLQKKETMITQNPNITADNLVEEIAKQVKHYPSEKIYGIEYSNNDCFFDVFVDGLKVYTNFNRAEAGNSGTEINHLLFHSGTHSVTYKLFPIYHLEEYGITKNTLTDYSDLILNLYFYDLKGDVSREVTYPEHQVPKVKVTSQGDTIYKFAGAGKTYYEGSFEVELDVPYKLQPPFATAQDLRKMDQKLLMTKLLAKYKEVWQIYKNRELDNIARLEFDNLKQYAISNYETKETIAEDWEVFYNVFKNNNTLEMQPLENYKLEFFADGKLVALMLDTKDNRFRGNTALWAKVDYEGGVRPLFLNKYFYIPQGETEFKVY
nr:hypothetical protein [uncultured Capnocytophaga sp.]